MKIQNLAWVVEAGFTVLRITENETTAAAEHSYWVSMKFEPASQKGVESVDYNYVEGYEITDFLKQHSVEQTQERFINIFQAFIEAQGAPFFTMKFSPLMKWKIYTKFHRS